MEQTQPQPEKPKLIFWKPENKGDTIKGKLEGAYKVGKGHSIKLLVPDERKEVFVNLSLIISDCLKRSEPRVKVGDEIGIIYSGTEKRTKIFDVYVNGKMIDRNAPVDLMGAIDKSIEAGHQK